MLGLFFHFHKQLIYSHFTDEDKEIEAQRPFLPLSSLPSSLHQMSLTPPLSQASAHLKP